MRIGIVAPPWFGVPPEAHGGVETLVAYQMDELSRRGIDLILYATGSISVPYERRSLFDRPQATSLYLRERVTIEAAHATFAYADGLRSGVDLFHDHSGRVGPAVAAWVGRPVLHTVHGILTPDKRALYRQFTAHRRLALSAISEAQRRSASDVPFRTVIHNGIDPDRYIFRTDKTDALLFLGRLTPGKGAHVAVDIARRAGRPLIIAGKLEPTPDAEQYFSRAIAPFVGKTVTFAGEVKFREKTDLLASAAALICPSQWEEPFGLAAIEALASGTPVLATSWGAYPEIITSGVHGFLGSDAAALASAVLKLTAIDSEVCRDHVRKHFSAQVMVDKYLAEYRALLRETQRPNGI
jgi:glycosyltransferase involved in cell wall biosynthesis